MFTWKRQRPVDLGQSVASLLFYFISIFFFGTMLNRERQRPVNFGQAVVGLFQFAHLFV